MDEMHLPPGDPHDRQGRHAPPGVIPLRLILEPGGAQIELAHAEVLVGRHSEADVRLPLPDVSRRHCRFTCTGGHWEVFDLQSLNGTHVNGERVEQSALHSGDRLKIGGFTFRIEIAAEENILKLLPHPRHNKAS
jgi:pSer/pThr/pTyr-binding forkhead associated (FHA) protein